MHPGRRGRAIQILHFAPPRGIPPVYFDKPYPCAPDGGGKTYGLLRCAMAEGHAVGIGQCVPWNRQGMLALIPEESGIRVQTLFYRQQLRTSPFSAPQAQVTEAEMRMGKQLVQAMTRPYQPEDYRDEYEEKLLAAIQRKIDGQEITAAAEPAHNVIDLMEALQKSLEMQAGRRGRRWQAQCDGSVLAEGFPPHAAHRAQTAPGRRRVAERTEAGRHPLPCLPGR